MFHKNYLPIIGMLALLMLFLSACTTTQTPSRKKMPSYLESGYYEPDNPFNIKKEGFNELSFITGQEDILINEKSVSFTVVPVKSAAQDETFFSLIKEYKPLTAVLLTSWKASANNGGALIDLRSNTAIAGMQAQYNLQTEEAIMFPVIFRWDKVSAGRAASYIGLLNNIPGVTVKKIQ